MPGAKRPTGARAAATPLAKQIALRLGQEVKASRAARKLTQRELGRRVGVRHTRLSQIERGDGGGAPLEFWVAMSIALDRPFRVEFGRDHSQEPRGAGHLRMQELVLELAPSAGFRGSFEIPTRPSDPSRSTDVRLLDRKGGRLVLVECWNTFGDLGAAVRSSDRKLAETEALAIALGMDDRPLALGLCWIVRDTKANRELLAQYPRIFESRFPGGSARWVRTLTQPGLGVPDQPGLVWCDVRGTRLFSRRAARPDAGRTTR